jgi:hypothetical protein
MIKIYCSGSIQKSTTGKNKQFFWSDTERKALADAVHPIEVRFLNPDDPTYDLLDATALAGRDMFQIKVSDFVVVDARERRGIGVGIEILTSRIIGIPLIVVAPQNTHYRMEKVCFRGSTMDNYIHPHLYMLADVIVDDFSAAGKWIQNYRGYPTELKDIRIIQEAIEVYKQKMLPHDEPMQQILKVLEKS